MWYVKLEGNNFFYEINELLKLYIDQSEIVLIEEKALDENQGFLLVCSIEEEDNDLFNISATLYSGKEFIDRIENKLNINTINSILFRKTLKRTLKKCIYDLLCSYFKKEQPWGILTGIRPTKIVHELLDEKMDPYKIKNILLNDYRISKNKIDLLLNISRIERSFLQTNTSDKVSIYISIPFCPSRCLYCSFPSNPLDCNNRIIVNEYIKALLYEIDIICNKLIKNHMSIDTLYIGGGTPTTLTADELISILTHFDSFFPLDDIREVTVEAGRPDTITIDKLRALKALGVERISINPQTMNLKTLKVIGRNHDPEEIEKSMEIARLIGFKTINMDLILGLPLETPELFENTMKKIEGLSPENLTIHTLAVKRSSNLKNNINLYNLPSEEDVNTMLKIAEFYTNKMGLIPYYMYRQKYMLGNFENIGYCIPNHECIYNIQMMEERQTIIGLGAGSSSKFYYPLENKIERIGNVTNLEHYINRVEEMVQRKVSYIAN